MTAPATFGASGSSPGARWHHSHRDRAGVEVVESHGQADSYEIAAGLRFRHLVEVIEKLPREWLPGARRDDADDPAGKFIYPTVPEVIQKLIFSGLSGSTNVEVMGRSLAPATARR